MVNSKEKNKGKILSINISKTKGQAKQRIAHGFLRKNFGLTGDIHAGPTKRQISLLSWEAIRRQQACPRVNPIRSRQGGTNGARKKGVKFKPGDFAENITTQGLDLTGIKIGERLFIKNNVILEVSQIGKKCHNYCQIYKTLGNCIMPKQGIFTKVIKGGKIAVGDSIGLTKTTN